MKYSRGIREKVFLQNPTQNDCVLRRSRSRALGDPKNAPGMPLLAHSASAQHIWF